MVCLLLLPFYVQSEELVREELMELIVGYRDDPDLQNLIDTIQSDVSINLESRDVICMVILKFCKIHGFLNFSNGVM